MNNPHIFQASTCCLRMSRIALDHENVAADNFIELMVPTTFMNCWPSDWSTIDTSLWRVIAGYIINAMRKKQRKRWNATLTFASSLLVCPSFSRMVVILNVSGQLMAACHNASTHWISSLGCPTLEEVGGTEYPRLAFKSTVTAMGDAC